MQNLETLDTEIFTLIIKKHDKSQENYFDISGSLFYTL